MLGNLIFSGLVIFILSLALVVVNYVFRAIGLYVIASKRGLKHKWRAFIPFASDYLLGQLTGETVMFMSKIKNSGLMLMLVHIAVFAVDLTYNVLYMLPNLRDLFAGGITFMQLFDVSAIEPAGAIRVWIGVMSVLSGLFNIGYVLLFVSIYFTFFRKYSPRNYMLFSILSVFLGIDGIFIFVVRNNEPVSYEQFVQSRRQYYDPYNPYNPYNGQGGSAPQRPADPFSEFEEKKKDDADPFGEFFGRGKSGTGEQEEKKDDDDIFH